MLFCHIKLFKPYANYFYDKIQDVFSLVSIDEFTSAMRGYKNSLDERFLRELSVPDQIGKNHKKNLIGFASCKSLAKRVAVAIE